MRRCLLSDGTVISLTRTESRVIAVLREHKRPRGETTACTECGPSRRHGGIEREMGHDMYGGLRGGQT